MPIFLCRWPNGDISFVEERTKDDAIEKLDEFGNADHSDIFQIREFLVDFRLSDEGTLELNYGAGTCGFGEETVSKIMEKAYPELDKLLMSDELEKLKEDSPECKRLVKEAVELERKRLWGKKKKLKEAKTELGKRVQREMGSSAVVADRIVERTGKKILQKFRPKGPSH